jgi:hypothetical protein
MIVVENRLRDMINVLPLMSNSSGEFFNVKFSFGDDKELMNYLIEKRGEIYPLIWYIYPTMETHKNNHVTISEAQFILAVKSNDHYLNQERFSTNYKNFLVPLFDNFIYLLKKSNIVNLNEEIKVVKFPNYSNEKLPGNRESLKSSEKHKTFDIWDALKVTLDMQISNRCFKSNIRFT